jgi:hypothetical protein
MSVNQMQAIESSDYFANVTFAGLQLLIPQSDIYSLEPTVDMTPCLDAIGAVGQLQQGNEVWSLYALSSDLTLLNSCPDSYRIAVLLKNIKPVYGLVCEQIDTLARNQISIHPIPTAMRNLESPLLALALYGEEVRYISSASALTRLFPMTNG